MKQGDGRAQTILIVEDEPANVALLSYVVEQGGYAVRVAACGTAALALIEDEPPALILLDLMLPDTNGIEVCRVVKNDPRFQSIPIIVLTALTHQAFAEQSMRAGADCFMRKPFDSQALLRQIRLLLSAQS